MKPHCDVMVIGAGPAGLAAAVAAHDQGVRVCLVEREARPGGILKQCIHDGFGILRYESKLSGPEYAQCELEQVIDRGIEIFPETFLLSLGRGQTGFELTLQNRWQGVFTLTAAALVAATGCRERTGRQILLHGTRPAGVYTAGTVQRLINIDGYLPGRRCVILGSGDIGLIMARRLVLEGAEVVGVYEIRDEPSGLTRNLVQCLDDYGIPLHLSTTVTRLHGEKRLEGVTVCPVDAENRPDPARAQYLPCDTLVLSVGLIPENEILEPLGVELDRATGGALVDQTLMTNVPGVFSCGNALHVSDLVDHVSESGEIAGRWAATHARRVRRIGASQPIALEGELLYLVPQRLDPQAKGPVNAWFRSRRTLRQARLEVWAGERRLLERTYPLVRPPEMERIVFDLDGQAWAGQRFRVILREVRSGG